MALIIRISRKNMVRNLAIILAMILPMGVFAQSNKFYIPRYITADMGGGLQSIQFVPHDGVHKAGMGFRFNSGCVFLFNNNWGVNIGLGLSSFHSKAKYNGIMEGNAYDSVNSLEYEFRTYYSHFTEKQTILQLEVPIMAFCQYKVISERFDVIGKSGFKLGFPISSKYTLMDGQYETRAMYPRFGVEFHDMPQHGFETVEAEKSKGKSKINSVNVSFVLEGGLSYKINKAFRVYAGMYFNYCISNLHKETVNPILSSDRKYNGTIGSSQIDRASLLSLGMSGGIIWDYMIKSHRSTHKYR